MLLQFALLFDKAKQYHPMVYRVKALPLLEAILHCANQSTVLTESNTTQEKVDEPEKWFPVPTSMSV